MLAETFLVAWRRRRRGARRRAAVAVRGRGQRAPQPRALGAAAGVVAASAESARPRPSRPAPPPAGGRTTRPTRGCGPRSTRLRPIDREALLLTAWEGLSPSARRAPPGAAERPSTYACTGRASGWRKPWRVRRNDRSDGPPAGRRPDRTRTRVPPPVEALLARLEATWPRGGGAAARRGRRARAPRAASRRGAPSPSPRSSRCSPLAVVVGLAQRSSPDVVAEARAALGDARARSSTWSRAWTDVSRTGSSAATAIVRDREGTPARADVHPQRALDRARPAARAQPRSRSCRDDGGAPHTIDFTFADGVTAAQAVVDDKAADRASLARRTTRACAAS